jgi:hypothetical protein
MSTVSQAYQLNSSVQHTTGLIQSDKEGLLEKKVSKLRNENIELKLRLKINHNHDNYLTKIGERMQVQKSGRGTHTYDINSGRKQYSSNTTKLRRNMLPAISRTLVNDG